MNESWNTPALKKRVLWGLIKKVGKHWRESEPSLREYGADVYTAWNHDLDAAIECFRSLEEQVDWMNRVKEWEKRKG